MKSCLHFARQAARAAAVSALFFSATEAANLTIAVSTTPLSTPFYVADKQGFFAQEGLRVTLQDCSGGKLCLSRALSGEQHLATASELPIMFRSFARKDFSILATFATTNRNVKLVTRKSAGIKAPKDLAGKRIGLVRGAAGEYFLESVLLTYGIDPRSVTVVDMTADSMETAAAKQTVDVFAAFEPGTFRLMKALKDDGYVIPLPTIYTMSFNLAGRNAVLQDRRDEIEKLLRALQKAISFIGTNPQETHAILVERLKVDASFVGWTWADYRFDLSLNQSLLTTLESQATWAIRQNLAGGKAMPDYLDLIDPRPLAKVRPASVTLVK